jgi:hypothetical protein
MMKAVQFYGGNSVFKHVLELSRLVEIIGVELRKMDK